MKISINEPCHENWDEMTPNQQGAFCGSCQKTVIDFSKKSISEIKYFFTKKPKEESVCGRFRQDQFHEMEFETFVNEFMSWKFLKRAAVICFMVIGTTLFSSCSGKEDTGEYEHTAGVVAINDSIMHQPINDTLDTKKTNDSLSLLRGSDTLKTGKPVKEKKKKKYITVQEPPRVMGEISEP